MDQPAKITEAEFIATFGDDPAKWPLSPEIAERVELDTKKATGRPVDGYTIIVSVMRNDDSEYGTREVSVGPEAFDQPHGIERQTISLLRAAKEDLSITE